MKTASGRSTERHEAARLNAFGTICIAILLNAGCDKAPPAPEQHSPATVGVAVMQNREITVTRELPGRTVASLTAEVRPRVNGIIEARLFDEGGHVKENQPLYRLDDTMYRADFLEARASLKTAEAAVTLARAESERTTQLYKSGLVSKQKFDSAQATLEQTDAQLAAAKASLAGAKVVLNYTRIASPIAGVIGRSAVTKGALVTADQPAPLAVVQQLDPMFVDISQSSREFLELRRAVAGGDLKEADLPVSIVLEDGSTYAQKGQIAFSEATVDQTTGSYTLRIVVANPDGLLLPGMYVRATIGTGVRENGMLVPQKAVTRAPDGSTSVMIVRPNNTVEPRAVVLGRSIENGWLVKSGLVDGDRVVTEGLQKIRAGDKVEVENQPPTAVSVGASK